MWIQGNDSGPAPQMMAQRPAALQMALAVVLCKPDGLIEAGVMKPAAFCRLIDRDPRADLVPVPMSRYTVCLPVLHVAPEMLTRCQQTHMIYLVQNRMLRTDLTPYGAQLGLSIRLCMVLRHYGITLCAVVKAAYLKSRRSRVRIPLWPSSNKETYVSSQIICKI